MRAIARSYLRAILFKRVSAMKLQQVLKNCLLRWKEITGFDFCLLNEQNDIFAATGLSSPPAGSILESFKNSEASSMQTDSGCLYKVTAGDDPAYILLVQGEGESFETTGKLAVCQVETLLSSYSGKSDRNRVMQDILFGRLSSAEIFVRARQFHINTGIRRAVLLVKTEGVGGEPVLETIRNIFGSRNKDYIGSLDENTTAIVHELKDVEESDDIESIACLLVDMLNTEVMIKARVSYSNICSDLSRLPDSYVEAVTAFEIGRIFFADRNVFGYSHLGIGRLLYQLPVEVCEMFIQEILGDESLNSLDEETLNIIRTFFENNLNLSETSRKLYVHRNTLVYRLDKIEKKYGLDIKTFEDALTFKLAMLVTDYINSKNNA